MTLIIKLLSYCSCLCGSLLSLSILQFLTYERNVEWSGGGWREKEWERKRGKERERVQYLLRDCKMRTRHFLMADSGRSDQALTDGLEWNVHHHTCGLCISSGVYMYTCIPVIHVWSLSLTHTLTSYNITEWGKRVRRLPLTWRLWYLRWLSGRQGGLWVFLEELSREELPHWSSPKTLTLTWYLSGVKSHGGMLGFVWRPHLVTDVQKARAESGVG